MKPFLALFAALLLLAGCSRVTDANYDRLKTDMTVDEATSLLGKPSRTEGGEASVLGVSVSGKTLVWESSDHKKISATFVNDKLVVKAKEGF